MNWRFHIRICALAAVLAMMPVILVSSRTHGETEQPAVVAAVSPMYPPIARAARVGGEVLVEVSIDRGGAVSSAKAIFGHKLIRTSAEAAAKQWRFAPLTDSSGEHRAVLTFAFRLMPRCTAVENLTSIFSPPYKVEVRGEIPEFICDDCSPEERERLRCK